MSKLTKDQAIVITAYTGILCCNDFSSVHEYIERKLNRPVWTHEFGSEETWGEIKGACREDFLSIVAD